MVQCGDVPLEFCERTPGCILIEGDADCPAGEMCEPVQRCVRDDDPRCDERDRDQCQIDGLCRLDIIQDCGPDGGPGVPDRMPQDGEREREFDPNRIIGVPCEEEWACVPNEMPPCALISINECRERMDCEVFEEEVCECEPREAPRDDGGNLPDPEPGNERALPPVPARRIQPPPDECPCRLEESCRSLNPCSELDNPLACNQADGCGWSVNPECVCAMPRPAVPCADGDPDCAEPPPPEEVCPPECFGCFPN